MLPGVILVCNLDTEWESSTVDLIDENEDNHDEEAVSKYDLRRVHAETTGSMVICLALASVF